MTCRTCRHLDVAPDKAGRIIPRKTNSYRCLAPIGPLPVLPVSVTGHYWNSRLLNSWPPAPGDRSYMSPDEGEGCPLYEARVT